MMGFAEQLRDSHKIAAQRARLATLPTARARQAVLMSEGDLERQVAAACAALGLLSYHTHRSDRSEAGYPDRTIVGGRVMWRELKTEKGRLSQAQIDWLVRLREAGCDADVWRPVDLLSGRLMGELRDLMVKRAKAPVFPGWEDVPILGL